MRAEEYALIVAGGSGSRMQSQVLKQFLLLNGKPILMHAVRAFYHYSPSIHIILVLPETAVKVWYRLCHQYDFHVPHQIVRGGVSRTESVKNGLEILKEKEGFIAIHDGVRPLISVRLIAKSFEIAKEKGNAIASIALKDSIRRLRAQGGSQAEDRKQFRAVQTPQTFRLEMVRKAYELLPAGEVLSDDASVIERHGWPVHLIEGDYHNIKITTPEDLRIAEAFLAKASARQ